MVEFQVKIEAGDLYNYLLMHAYTGSAGIVGTCVGALLIVVFSYNQQWIFLICGCIILGYLPWTLFLKSKQMALTNEAFKQPLHYTLDEEGITVSQNETQQKQTWDTMYKAVSTTRSIIVYTTPNSAAIFPNRELKDQRSKVVEMISTHMEPKKVKIRF